jgi:hypothetical protein
MKKIILAVIMVALFSTNAVAKRDRPRRLASVRADFINQCMYRTNINRMTHLSYDQRYSLALECTERSLDRYLEIELLRSEIELNKARTEALEKYINNPDRYYRKIL